MSKSKYNRTDFYTKNEVNGIMESDLVTNDYREFNKNFGFRYYTLKAVDLRRFDILSLRFFRSDKFWWILAKVNNIDDLWNDPVVGQVIKIPDKRDIENFYIKLTKAGKRR